MLKPLHLIYVPGLGDQDPKGQYRAVATWRWLGVSAELVQMNWSNNEPWTSKLERLLKAIDLAAEKNKDVCLIGASAGASAVINAFALRQDIVIGCVLIAGKVNRPEKVGSSYRSQNPAFVDSIYQSPQSLTQLDKKALQRIQSRYAVADETVYKADSRINGANNRVVPMIGHVPTIATQIVFDTAGIMIGYYLLRQLIEPPFLLF